MSILKLKYKAHKLVNTIFYLLVFVVGFLLGFASEKIDYNKLISQVLMIDNVSAYSETFTSNSSYKVTSTNYYNEEFLYNFFNYYANDVANLNLSFTDYKYVYSIYEKSTFSEIFYCPSSRNITGNTEFYFTDLSGCFGFTFSSSSVKISDLHTKGGYSKSYYYLAATEDYSSKYGTKFKKLLDFSDYTLKLEFNEDLFKDNPDFKEVCVNNYDTFSITSNQIHDYDDNNNPTFHDFDFIWFPHGMAYLSIWMYDSESPSHVGFPNSEDDFVGKGYWLNTKEEIENHFSNNNPGVYLEVKGYKDKYSYYNWTLYPFEMTFTTDYYFYTVFSFNNSYLKQAGISTKVDNAYIEYLDGTKKENSEQYCFYIKNEYDINILNKNESGDFNSSITILDGINKDDVTYEIELGTNIDGLFTKVNSFISEIRLTVNFIHHHIFELYNSMPLIVRSFIFSFLVLIVTSILIRMVIR